jgi:hypothetical protein
MARNPNYVVGAGKLFFNQFLPGTKTLSGGSRYLGNSPELSLSQDEDKLDHYNSDGGVKVKDASVTLQNDSSGSFSLDDISPENLALWFRGAVESNVIAGGAVAAYVVSDAVLGSTIQLGLSDHRSHRRSQRLGCDRQEHGWRRRRRGCGGCWQL